MIKGIREDGPSCLKLTLLAWAAATLGGTLTCGILLWILTKPLPVPEPYPDAMVTTSQHGIANWGTERVQIYEMNRTLAEIEQYYQRQMEGYCRQTIDFIMTTECRESVWPCTRAECKIPLRYESGPLHGQWFTVELYPISDVTTRVIQVTAWTN